MSDSERDDDLAAIAEKYELDLDSDESDGASRGAETAARARRGGSRAAQWKST